MKITNETIRLIYKLKNPDNKNWSADKIVAHFYSELTGTSISNYKEDDLTEIALNTFKDYISTADNPMLSIDKLFGYLHLRCKNPILYNKLYKDEVIDNRLRQAIWLTLELTPIKRYLNKDVDKLECINEFKEI